jgi:hypothetical protein
MCNKSELVTTIILILSLTKGSGPSDGGPAQTGESRAK